MDFPYFLLSKQADEILKRNNYSVYTISSDIIILVGKSPQNHRLFFVKDFNRVNHLEDYILNNIEA